MQRERPRRGVDRRRISKLLSLILRHRPDEFGLNMDEYGYIPLEEVTEAVQQRYAEVGEEDIRRLVEDSRPKRFEIVEEYIRALYGHSFYLEIDDDPIDPPEKLFMGTTVKAGRKVPEEGLRPVDRSYLHLSMTREVAEARSHEPGEPCVVEIEAKRAFEEGGIEFYARGEVILSREIPVEFVGEVSGLDAAPVNRGDERSRPGGRRSGEPGPPAESEAADRVSGREFQEATSEPVRDASRDLPGEPITYGRKPRRETGRR
ncbi:MAG: RNA 2'-phosphotransferase [Candidatus Aminicenantes bacterium]|nr:RNA 2'-phosphotransferase [Candidatus Aminicenantes bacterium]